MHINLLKASLCIGAFLFSFPFFLISQENQSSETAKKLVALAEYLYAYEQATLLHQQAEQQIETEKAKWFFKDVDGAFQTKVGMFDAIWDSYANIERALEDFEGIKKIEQKDLQEAQKEASWLPQPIGFYIVWGLATDRRFLNRLKRESVLHIASLVFLK